MPVPANEPGGRCVVSGPFKVYLIGVDVQEEGCVHVTTMNREACIVHFSLQRHCEDVDGADPCATGPDGAESFLMRILPVRRDDDELHDSASFPRSDEIVHGAVQGLTAQRRGSRKGHLCGGVDTIFNCGGPEDLELGGQVIRESFYNCGVAAERKVGTVLFGCTHRKDQAGVANDAVRDRSRR